MLLDSAPPRRVAAALWIPAYAPAGFFAFDLEPGAGGETTVTLPFVPWGDPDPGGANVPPLTARVVATDGGEGGWDLRLALDVP